MIGKLLDAGRICLRISQQPLPRRLRWSIVRSYLSVFTLGRLDRESRRARLLDFDVEYLTLRGLRYVFREIFTDLAYLFESPRAAPVIVDCGSNIGMAVMFFKTIYPDARILAFEPSEQTFACLKRNVERNALDGITLHRAAISDQDGVADLFSDPNKPGSLIASLLPERSGGRPEKVETVRLSRFLDGEVDFVKIDIEGAEARVVAELAETGKLNNIKQMMIEYHHHIARRKDDLSEILRILEQSNFGYQIGGELRRPLDGEVLQAILIYAYRKENRATEGV